MNSPDTDLLKTLEWRYIGPHRGGRVVAVAGDPSDHAVFYFGACAGGVWKTDDGGTYWQNVSDGFFNTASVGAIAVAESDHNVVFAGMGESCIRLDVSHGDGVYKSTDRGKTWAHVGLEDTRHIARVRIHPNDPDVVYVAALGHAFGPNEQRGVYRSKDGGGTWDRILYRSENAGAIDLAMDPHNPRVLYAAIWETRRTPWSLSSGGPGSGLFKTTDGGDTWEELANSPGMPEGIKGRIGVAVSPAQADRVWAIVESEEGALLRSDDGGVTWERVSEDRSLRQRSWYYHHVFADPQDADTVWVLNLKAWKSVDGGRNFVQVSTPHGDNHDLWIDPRDPRRMIEGNDGGACVSFNGGDSWSSIQNQPTSQFYHVTTDSRFPYRVYATQQDNTAISVPSRTYKGAIPWEESYSVGNSESGHIAVDPVDPNIVYSGAIGSAPGGGGVLLRYDHSTRQVRNVTVWPELNEGWGAKDLKYRFQWTFPISFSPHDPQVLYTAANRVFRSTDEGKSWEPISPDLTRDDISKQGPSGGPISKDTTGAEHYCTIFSFVESPHEPGVFWAGSDDGLVHLSRDGGESWKDITPPDLPEWAVISMIELSPHDASTAYIAALRYKLDDNRPYLFKTTDSGETWGSITTGIPEDQFTRCIREDPERRGLLYAGTEVGVHFSLDGGESWSSLQTNLPVSPIHDLVVRDGDLVVATHGRSFWILDDLTPLHQLTKEAVEAPAHLFRPRPTYAISGWPPRLRERTPGRSVAQVGGVVTTFVESETADGRVVRRYLDAGQDCPGGVVVSYHLKDRPEHDVLLEILDSDGGVIKSYSSAESDDGSTDTPREPRVSAEAGIRRFVWDMHYPDARKVPDDVTTENSLSGPLAPPGEYQARLTVDGESYSESFEILKDPRVDATQQDLEEQHALLLRIREKLSETQDAINRLRSVRRQVQEWVSRAEGHWAAARVSEASQVVYEKLDPIEGELIQTRAVHARDTLNFPSRLNAKLAALPSVVSTASGVPTRQSYEVLDDLSGRVDVQIEALTKVVDEDVPIFIDLIHELELPAIVPKASE